MIDKKIPKSTIASIINTIVKDNDLRKSSDFINALKQKTELYTIEVFESISYLTKLGKRKTMTAEDIRAFIEVTNLNINENEKNRISIAPINRLANMVIKLRKSRKSLILVSLIIENYIKTLVQKTIKKFLSSKEANQRMTLYSKDLQAVLA